MFTMGNYRYLYAFEALNNIFLCHYWVFTVKYLETGLKYTFFDSDLFLWARYLLYWVLVLFVAYFGGLYFYLAFSYPVFKPDATSEAQCIKRYQPYQVQQFKWEFGTV